MNLTVFVLALTLSVAAHAQVHRCTGADGKTTYSESPCQGAIKSNQVNIPLRTEPQGGAPPTRNAYAAELNNKIADALKRDDFATARRLANNDEHHRIINEVEQIVREERQAAKAERRARRPTVCNTFGQTHGSARKWGDTASFDSTTYGTTICNK